jgi:undecaprenyl diphosphate synthase
MSLKEQLDKTRIPNHVAVIMDGNGRWAKQQGKARIFGHEHGVQSVRDTVEAAAEIGVKYLTLYAFSTENWNRPESEVIGLMELLVTAIHQETKTLMENNIRLQTIGNTAMLPETCRKELNDAIDRTSGNTRMTLVLALSYSSRWEITEAVKKIAEKVKNNELAVSDINDDLISAHLCTAGIPDPELMIRTSGEERISNYLLWQLAYSELYFTETLWPEFRKENFYMAIAEYQKRERRFGKTSEQLVNG